MRLNVDKDRGKKPLDIVRMQPDVASVKVSEEGSQK